MEWHFWLHMVGTLMYVISMWVAGVTEGMMWRDLNANGTLAYSFIASLEAIKPLYVIRFLGGVLILSGMGVMAWNLWHTAADARKRIIEPIPVPVKEPTEKQVPPPIPATEQ
jgi:cytochrome c oxidase cbb3-type subunit 1